MPPPCARRAVLHALRRLIAEISAAPPAAEAEAAAAVADSAPAAAAAVDSAAAAAAADSAAAAAAVDLDAQVEALASGSGTPRRGSTPRAPAAKTPSELSGGGGGRAHRVEAARNELA